MAHKNHWSSISCCVCQKEVHTASCHKWRAFLCTNVNGCACKECVCMHVVWCENACMTKRKGKDVQQHSVDCANPATHTTAARDPAVFFGSPCIKSSQHYQYYLTQSDCTLGLQNWYRPYSGQDLWWTWIPTEMPTLCSTAAGSNTTRKLQNTIYHCMQT